ncbi:Bug family tripartite tricarboxylate transporter substrate binding protein [Advenella mimigardefordensis]|uniref:Putative Bug-like extracytoplasmic solute binding receptor, TTT family n=1 Tax=Advenella mimigardefordensis (strain DSM 17166 / LMG 22922 / DPN7) TaxID=1247726 RepID=W0P662_ADVMD|nr:tripartite tricarboxylate transporter substrate binding protein [Advenella mimigardefordensis]AHG62354.1 putative Bug-like extracytoplasmic solute binding receptor, TTT family [Advenella mimigardefordensis DPN7]
MFNKKTMTGLTGGMLLVATLINGVAHAQDWPQRPVRMVVPYTPGGGTDSITRIIADKISQTDKGIQFVIENKPGAGGNIGMTQVARAKPDGLMLGMGQTSNLAINPVIMPDMKFDASKDFTPIAVVAELPTVLVVRADSPYQSLADVIAAAKAKPGQLKQALATVGTVGHLAGEMLSHKAGIKVLNVPYKGASPALTELIGGQTDYMFATPVSVINLIADKDLRALAVTSSKRIAAMPDVPTVAEQGYEGFNAVDWKMIVGPAGVPKEAVDRISKAFMAVSKDPEFIKRMEADGNTVVGGSAAGAQAYLTKEQVEWRTLLEAIKFQLK